MMPSSKHTSSILILKWILLVLYPLLTFPNIRNWNYTKAKYLIHKTFERFYHIGDTPVSTSLPETEPPEK